MTDMHPQKPGTGPRGPKQGAAELLDDWVTIWQSELAGLVVDPEMQDALLRVVDGWAVQSRAVLRMMAPMLEGSGDGTSTAGPDAAARAAARAAAPDERDALLRSLLERVAELERRLAGGADIP
jgi:hypothetical protein